MTHNFSTGVLGKRWRAYGTAVLYALAVFAPLFILYLIAVYGVDVPYWDQWEFVPLLMKYRTGTLSFSDLFAQHNEHRIFFPRLIMLALASATGWDIRYEFYTGFIIAGLTFVLLILLLRDTGAGRCSPWLSALSAFLIFSPVQMENWIWGWQIQIFLGVFGAVAAIWAIDRWPGRWRGLAVAVCAASVASFSFNNGLLTWPVVGVFMAAQGRWKARHIGLLTAVFASVVFLYYHGYIKPGHHPSLLYPLNHPADYIKYMLAYLGSPLAYNKKRRAIAAGIILSLALCAASVRAWRSGRERFQSALPWLALALYSILSAAATGIGRLGFGVDQALAGRYTTISTPFAVSTAVLSASWLGGALNSPGVPRRRLLRAVVYTVSILLLYSYGSSFKRGVKEFVRESEVRQRAKLCLKDAAAADDACLKVLYPDAAALRGRMKMLVEMGILKWGGSAPLPGGEADRAPTAATTVK